jgi:hypothetical protein
MRNIILIFLSMVFLIFGFDVAGTFFLKTEAESLQQSAAIDLESLEILFLASNLYADDDEGVRHDSDKDSESYRDYGKGTGHFSDGEERHRNYEKHNRHKKGKKHKKSKDRGKGPSVPALPMVSSIILGLCGIGVGRILLRKKR